MKTCIGKVSEEQSNINSILREHRIEKVVSSHNKIARKYVIYYFSSKTPSTNMSTFSL